MICTTESCSLEHVNFCLACWNLSSIALLFNVHFDFLNIVSIYLLFGMKNFGVLQWLLYKKKLIQISDPSLMHDTSYEVIRFWFKLMSLWGKKNLCRSWQYGVAHLHKWTLIEDSRPFIARIIHIYSLYSQSKINLTVFRITKKVTSVLMLIKCYIALCLSLYLKHVILTLSSCPAVKWTLLFPANSRCWREA